MNQWQIEPKHKVISRMVEGEKVIYEIVETDGDCSLSVQSNEQRTVNLHDVEMVIEFKEVIFNHWTNETILVWKRVEEEKDPDVDDEFLYNEELEVEPDRDAEPEDEDVFLYEEVLFEEEEDRRANEAEEKERRDWVEEEESDDWVDYSGSQRRR